MARDLPDEDATALLDLTREIAMRELAPHVESMEAAAEFPREAIRRLGRSGLLGLPYPEEFGGGGQPFEVYLQVIEELARVWVAVAVGVSVHTLACFPVATWGSEKQRKEFLPDMLGGELLGAYCLSEAHSGSDAAALTTRAVMDGETYVVDGAKAWVTHAGAADFYNLMVRTGGHGASGISCLLVDAATPGLSPQPAERKMGMRSSPTATIALTSARVPADRLIAGEGEGFRIAMSALDSGRLGIAAAAVGLAQSALDAATAYAKSRHQFGRPITEFQGVLFLLADMATSVAAARSLYLAAARRKDAGLPYSELASMAKLTATDAAMKVTTDAIQVLGGSGYVSDFPVERYFREAKVMQIFEGTNQIQRLVIGRSLTRP